MKARMAIVACLVAGAAWAANPDSLTVQLREVKLRQTPQFFGAPVATLVYGDKVQVIEKQPGWYRVRADGGAEGWLNESSVTDRKITVASGRGPDRTGVSADEVALAGKGFNPQVESEYKSRNPDLAEAFRVLEGQMTLTRVDDQALRTFLKEGDLWPDTKGSR